ncbi:dephospho-CoA kinase [Pseudosulfitobacter sp. SM2401]|uniref:dephospho-CoA kinase n=1 Tax=Pseudosulfitobacter sp. SM2401 TaxID=3350098 RepID=UPI0036F194CC
MFKLGLTGSIGMGKSTTAQMFGDLGCDVYDADAAVHRMYGKGGLAIEPMRAMIPAAVVNDEISRDHLREAIMNDPTLLKKIEGVVHPLLGQDRADFMAKVTSDIVVFDIPLLFETGGQVNMNAVACVWIDAQTQEKRVMERGIMTQEQFEAIRAKQLPADEKRDRADYVIVTDTPEHARAQVAEIVNSIRQGIADA